MGFITILSPQTAILAPGTWIGILSQGLKIAIKSNFLHNFIGFKVCVHGFYAYNLWIRNQLDWLPSSYIPIYVLGSKNWGLVTKNHDKTHFCPILCVLKWIFMGFMHTNCWSGSDLIQLLSYYNPIHVPKPKMWFQ